MKRLDLVAFGKDTKALANVLEYAVAQLKMGTPSENITFEDNSHVDFDVKPSTKEEFQAQTGVDPDETPI